MGWFSDIFKTRQEIIREYEDEKRREEALRELTVKHRRAKFVDYQYKTDIPTFSRFDIPGDVFQIACETRDFIATPVCRLGKGNYKREMCDILSKTGEFLHATKTISSAGTEIVRLQLDGEAKLKSLI